MIYHNNNLFSTITYYDNYSLCSVSGCKAFKLYAEYGLSKACLDMVTKQFALELGPNQIRVNSVNPTYVLTDGIKDLFAQMPEVAEKKSRDTPMARFCEINEAVEPILYMLSDHSSMVTGTIHLVDGGLLCCIPV